MYWLTAHEIDPGANAHLLAGLHHLEGLVQEHLARQAVVDHLDDAVREREAPAGGVLLHADAAAEGELDHDAAAERVGDVVVPEGEVALFLEKGEKGEVRCPVLWFEEEKRGFAYLFVFEA
jgi:hypothetical protein